MRPGCGRACSCWVRQAALKKVRATYSVAHVLTGNRAIRGRMRPALHDSPDDYQVAETRDDRQADEMPELPDIAAYLSALEARIVGQVLEKVRLGSPFLLRTVQPPLASVEGRVVRGLRHVGKRIAI